MRRRLLLLLAAPLLLLGACADLFGPSEEVSVRAFPEAIAIRNDSDRPLYTLLVSAHIQPLIDWIPMICDDCGKVEPGATRLFPVDQIIGASSGDTVVVNMWRAVVGPGGVVPGEMSFRRVKLSGIAVE